MFVLTSAGVTDEAIVPSLTKSASILVRAMTIRSPGDVEYSYSAI